MNTSISAVITLRRDEKLQMDVVLSLQLNLHIITEFKTIEIEMFHSFAKILIRSNHTTTLPIKVIQTNKKTNKLGT